MVELNQSDVCSSGSFTQYISPAKWLLAEPSQATSTWGTASATKDALFAAFCNLKWLKGWKRPMKCIRSLLHVKWRGGLLCVCVCVRVCVWERERKTEVDSVLVQLLAPVQIVLVRSIRPTSGHKAPLPWILSGWGPRAVTGTIRGFLSLAWKKKNSFTWWAMSRRTQSRGPVAHCGAAILKEAVTWRPADLQ